MIDMAANVSVEAFLSLPAIGHYCDAERWLHVDHSDPT